MLTPALDDEEREDPIYLDTIDCVRRFRKTAFNGLAILSLFLFLAAATSWIRSLWVSDRLGICWPLPPMSDAASKTWAPEYRRRQGFVSISLGRGLYALVGGTASGGLAGNRLGYEHVHLNFQPRLSGTRLIDRLGLGAGTERVSSGWNNKGNSGEISDSYLAVPFWLLLLLSIPMPSIWLYVRTRRGHIVGHCHHCGYDLRATPERCPECGTISQVRE